MTQKTAVTATALTAKDAKGIPSVGKSAQRAGIVNERVRDAGASRRRSQRVPTARGNNSIVRVPFASFASFAVKLGFSVLSQANYA